MQRRFEDVATGTQERLLQEVIAQHGQDDRRSDSKHGDTVLESPRSAFSSSSIGTTCHRWDRGVLELRPYEGSQPAHRCRACVEAGAPAPGPGERSERSVETRPYDESQPHSRAFTSFDTEPARGSRKFPTGWLRFAPLDRTQPSRPRTPAIASITHLRSWPREHPGAGTELCAREDSGSSRPS